MSGPHTEDPRITYERIEKDQPRLYAERAARRTRRTEPNEAQPDEAPDPDEAYR